MLSKFLWSLLVISLVLLIPLHAFSQEGKAVYLNGEPVDNFVVDGTNYVTLDIFKQYGYDYNFFTDVPYVRMQNGLYVYDLLACCEKVGLIKAEDKESELQLTIDFGKAIVKIIHKDPLPQEKVSLYIYDGSGNLLKTVSLNSEQDYTVIIRSGNYYFRTEDINMAINPKGNYSPHLRFTYWEGTAAVTAGESVAVELKEPPKEKPE